MPVSLPQDSLDHRAMARGGRAVKTVAYFLCGVDAQAVVDRSGEVRWSGGQGGGFGGVPIARAPDAAALDSAAGENRSEDLAPVIAAVLAGASATDLALAHFWCAAHLAGPEDERIVEHAALVQVLQKR